MPGRFLLKNLTAEEPQEYLQGNAFSSRQSALNISDWLEAHE